MANKPGDISSWVNLLVLPLCIPKAFSPCNSLERRSSVKRQRQEECITSAICNWGVPGGNLQLVREVLAEASPSFIVE